MKCILRTDIDQVNLLQQTLAANDADVDEEALMQGGKGGATRKFGNKKLNHKFILSTRLSSNIIKQ